MNIILNKITGSITGLITGKINLCSCGKEYSLLGIIFFLIILLGGIVLTTSLKSARIKELENKIKELKSKEC